MAGILAAPEIAPLCIRVAGPNAGHTVVNPATGNRHALRQIPAGAVTNPNATPCIAAGSEIDLSVLENEVQALEADGIKIRDRLRIDPQATIIESRHLAAEDDADLHLLIGSTGKGIGAARADRLMRQAKIAGQYPNQLGQLGRLEAVAPLARMSVYSAVQIEGTQGYGLGLHAGHYPKCTSSDCTALDVLQMAQVNPWSYPAMTFKIWLVLRPYPIRVAGASGPMRDETSWEALGLEPEYTTVTHKMRRVGHWDGQLAQAAVAANGGYDTAGRNPLRVALTMADQIDPALAGVTDAETIWFSPSYQNFANQMLSDIGRRPALVTTSDRTWADMTGWEQLS